MVTINAIAARGVNSAVHTTAQRRTAKSPQRFFGGRLIQQRMRGRKKNGAECQRQDGLKAKARHEPRLGAQNGKPCRDGRSRQTAKPKEHRKEQAQGKLWIQSFTHSGSEFRNGGYACLELSHRLVVRQPWFSASWAFCEIFGQLL